MSVGAPQVRGWCPGALRPMESGDGLLVRVRPRCGRLAISDAIAIANAAERHGNGLIDVTRRANLQLRGLTPDQLPELWEELSHHVLIDESAEAEAVRNVMVAPLVTPYSVEIARALEHALLSQHELWELPAKFCFIVDEGDAVLPLDEERADIRIKTVRVTGGARAAIGCDRSDGVAWLGSVQPNDAAGAAVSVARVFLSLHSDARMRLRDLSEPMFRRMQLDLGGIFDRLPNHPEQRPCSRALGKIRCDGTLIAAGIAAPFGRVNAYDLRAFATAAQEHGIAEFHLSAWRALYLPPTDEPSARKLLGAALAHGFIVDSHNPLTSIDACPGTPGCRSGLLDTRRLATELAPLLPALGFKSCHVSGCSKGCARSKPSDLTLVGTGEGLVVMRYDTAQGVPRMLIPPARLSELPDLLRTV